jgi:hypothetical protein
MKVEITAQIELIDSLIRSGDHLKAEAQLEKIINQVIPREFLWKLASLSRRLSKSEKGIRLLNPIVRPSAKKPMTALPHEKVEYAACLIRIGLLSEAHELLDQVEHHAVPQSFLYRAFAHMALWDFASSNEALLKFIASPGISDYEILIAKVNLAVGWVFDENVEKSKPLLNELLGTTKKSNNLLLYCNTLELAAQQELTQANWALAEQYLDLADKALNSPNTFDAFLIRKKRATLEVLRGNTNSKNEMLLKVREEALKLHYWESVRDCDFYLALANKNSNLAKLLYFGTPYTNYKNKIAAQLNIKPSIFKKNYFWTVGEGEKEFTIDSLTGENSKSDYYLKAGQVPQRLFRALTCDYYRPKRLPELFENIFPGEYYSPESSSLKMYQAFKRLRLFLKKSRIPLEISESNGHYKISTFEKNKVKIICFYTETNLQSSKDLVKTMGLAPRLVEIRG